MIPFKKQTPQIERRSFLLFILLGITLTGNAKLIQIDIKKVFEEAGMIRTIVVTGYSDTIMFYRYENSRTILKRRYYRVATKGLITKEDIQADIFEGKWPVVGQTVLMVTSRLNPRLLLFATKRGDYYRFWDPLSAPFANSIFVISRVDGFMPLPNCKTLFPEWKDFWSCEDGCLVLVKKIKEQL